jgi:serine/threonine protein phosphatase PrpC
MPVGDSWKKFSFALQTAQHALRARRDLPSTSDSTLVLTKVERGAKGTRILEGMSIGDSRAYVWVGSKEVKNGERLQMITHDNSILYDYCVKTGRTHDYLTLQKEVDNGKDPFKIPGFIEFFGKFHPESRIDQVHSRILASIRDYNPDQVSYFKKQIDEHDRILVCSDGLYEVLTFDEINDIFIKHKHLNAQHLANKLKEAARNKIKNNPDKKIKNDDISVVIIDSNDRPKPKFTPLQKRIALGVVAAAGVITTALGIGHIGSDDTPQIITPTPKPLDTRTSTPIPYRPTVTRAPGSGLQIGSPPTGTPEPPPPQPPQKPTSTLYAPSSKP